MSLDYRTLPFRSRFKANWGGTLGLLEREIRHLNGKDVTLAIGVTPREVRIDGGVRADARIREPGVVLSFRSGADQMTFPCDTYDFWQDNARAVALALEALRAVDRHGVQQGRQYQGFKALPASTNPTLSTERAAEILRLYSASDPLASSLAAKDSVRAARSYTHPDARGGDRTEWDRVQLAADRVGAHFGVQL